MMIGGKSVRISNRLVNLARGSMAVRLQSRTSAPESTSQTQQKMPPGTKVEDPPLTKDVEKKLSNKSGELKFEAEPMGEDIAVVLKPPAELKDAKFYKHAERSQTFENADYMEKGSDFTEAAQRESLEEENKK